jgi:hypothetical protein
VNAYSSATSYRTSALVTPGPTITTADTVNETWARSLTSSMQTRSGSWVLPAANATDTGTSATPSATVTSPSASLRFDGCQPNRGS